MLERELTVINRLGLHARAAAKFVQTAGHYGCDVLVARDGAPVNGICTGTTVTVTGTGTATSTMTVTFTYPAIVG